MAYEESAEQHFKLPDQKNKFKNKNTFRIKVLTHPSAFSGPAAALTAFKDPNSSPNEARSDGPASKYVFMGRILDPEMGHHRFLQDPCDIKTISKENSEKAALLTVLHAKIIMSTKSHVPSFKVGDYIIAEAFPGDNNMIFDLQHMRFTQVDDVFSGDYSTTQCEDLATLMVNGMDDYVGYLSDFVAPLSCDGNTGKLTKNVKDLKPSNSLRDSLKRSEHPVNCVYDDDLGGACIESYDNLQGYATIGIGHLIYKKGEKDEREKYKKYLKGGEKMTTKQMEDLYDSDIKAHSPGSEVKVELTQGQYDALVSLIFNIGQDAWKNSNILKHLNARDCEKAVAAFGDYVTSKGEVKEGLVNRREREASWFVGAVSVS